jgi:hypothetical protein
MVKLYTVPFPDASKTESVSVQQSGQCFRGNHTTTSHDVHRCKVNRPSAVAFQNACDELVTVGAGFGNELMRPPVREEE